MKVKMINIRDFQRNMKGIIEEIEQGQAFIVLRNGRPVFKVNSVARKMKDVGYMQHAASRKTDQ